jgi:starch synthase
VAAVKILMSAAELAPFVRTGGLGNAVEGLAGALARLGHEVTVTVPGYRDLEPEGTPIGGSWYRIPDPRLDVLAYRDASFARPGVYGPEPGTGYDDNWLRFGRFARATADLAGDFDVLHLHDAHVGAAALLASVPTVFTIHNAAHPMLGPLDEAAALLGVAPEASMAGGALEWYGAANYLKAGMVGAGRVTTVSPGHAAELAVPDTSFGLSGIVASLAHPIVGILNGIDTTSWDPTTDATLPAPFSADDLKGKKKSRAALMAVAGLSDGQVFGNVGRMARQKGLGLLEPTIDELVAEGFRLVLVGNGELDATVDDWVQRYPGEVAHLPYQDSLSRLVSAGADAYLMPSEFEPCGLGQLYAMRYGTPPVVRLTGGLADSVRDIDEHDERGTGLGFRTFEPDSLAKTIRRAMRYHLGLPRLWNRMQMNGMTTDWSWEARAAEYEAVYAPVG